MGPDTWGAWSVRSWKVGGALVHPLGRGSARFRGQKSGPFRRFRRSEASVVGFFEAFPIPPFGSWCHPLSAKRVFVREMKASIPFIPTTTHASPGPFMDILPTRRRARSPSARLVSVDETPGVSPDHLPNSCPMALPSSPCIPDSRAI